PKAGESPEPSPEPALAATRHVSTQATAASADAERQEYADSYARGPGRGMDERTRRTIAKMHQRRNPPAV
ncbi:MAG: hypothetical protein ACTH0G_08985, partial [Corynebacterium variabile]